MIKSYRQRTYLCLWYRHQTFTQCITEVYIRVHRHWTFCLWCRHHSFTKYITLLDMSAGFDTINHALLNKLARCYGISENVYVWISSYRSVKDHSQTVHHESSTSTWRVLQPSIPQGSVLRLVQVPLYTEEMNRIIYQYNLQLQCYVDDRQVHSSCKPDKKDELIKSTLTYIER